MRKLHLNHNIYGAFFVLVIMGLTAVTYFTTSINQETHTVQSQAAGTCGNNCDNKSVWISDCLRYNGSDKTSQCNDWFNAECSACGSSGDGNNSGGGTPNTGSVEPFDPTATANDATVQNLCGANPNDPRCCKINEWKNANLGTNFKVCPDSTGGTGGTSVPTAAPTLIAGTAGSCNNGQIPNGSWACFSTTKVVQCINGKYQNETNCTSCRGISATQSSICKGANPNTTDGVCTYTGDPDCKVTPTSAWGNPLASPTPYCGGPGQGCCVAGPTCSREDLTCRNGKCMLVLGTPTPTPASQVFLPIVQNGQPTPTTGSQVFLPIVQNGQPTPTVVQTANPNACGQPGAGCCSTAFGQSACVTSGYECIAGKCRVGYAGFDDTNVTQVQTKLLECTTGSSDVQCTKPEVITVNQELIFNGCFALPDSSGFMCTN